MIALPAALASSRWAAQLEAAVAATASAGTALLELRGTISGVEASHGQLKTSVDLAAEGWVIGFLEGTFPDATILAEERFERAGLAWPGATTYWTVDALDGTRSYVEGFAGFCVQVAYVEDGQPRAGVIAEPVARHVYVAADGAGAWRLSETGAVRLTGPSARAFAPGLRFVDSTRPGGGIGALFRQTGAHFVECGSVGLKICRVVEDAADVYAKAFRFKLWDVAPGEVLARETGVALTTLAGDPIDYAGSQVHYEGVLATSHALSSQLVAMLRSPQ